ncbi:MAG TPA: DUF6152 family protein [Gammaproteobacteria bacterium]|nr:DUF6152 family protein [Gammaproteobacteria bacterium]
MKAALLGSWLSLALFAGAGPAHAHHSVALYDTDHLVTIEGVVTRVEWTSPHVFVYFTERKADGSTREWSMELDPPVLLRRYGWHSTTVSVGDAITCTGAPARSGAALMRGAIVTLGDGTQLRVWSRV